MYEGVQWMDPLQLLADLEGLRDKIPSFLQNDFENLIASIRNIYEMSVKLITPSQPVHDGKHNLIYHHTNIDTLHTQLNTGLTSFQQVYTGHGSDAYYTTTTTSLQNLQTIRDHLVDASQFHDTMAVNFDQAAEAKIALVSLLVGLGITLGVLVFSAGTTAPATVPAAILEAGGGAVSIGLLTEAEAAALAAVMSLVWAALPGALLSGLLGTAATELLIHNLLSFAKKPRSDTANQQEKAEFERAVALIERIIGRKLTKGERRELHDAITGMKYSIEEIVAIGETLFSGRSPGWNR
jgi:hypothetical protein